MRFVRTISQGLGLAAVALVLAGCNPATRGWSLSGGGTISKVRLIAAKQNCGYVRARKRAIILLDAPGDKQQNRHRAAMLLSKAEQCMRKRGIHYKPHDYKSFD
jgi:uncharacterized protein (DUF2336 family)